MVAPLRLDGGTKEMDEGTQVVRPDGFAVRAQLAQLRQEHRDLDMAIDALQTTPRPDSLQIQRLKKRKLLLKDRIQALEDLLLPDIIA